MIPWHDDGQARFYHGDVRAVLRGLEAESVQTVVTSPPYWSLRDYGVEPAVWGGTMDCGHEWGAALPIADAYSGTARWQHEGISRQDTPEAWEKGTLTQGQFCQRCGAWSGALGLEPTPDLFVAHIVEVFREVLRVLRKDGTLWLNIGDSYAASRSGPVGEFSTLDGGNSAQKASRVAAAASRFAGRSHTRERFPEIGVKPKDLVGIPWMVAFALRADGWWLRQDIIWSKPNPMPESVTDRCTKAHEYLFLLTKSERYWSDFGAIREPAAYPEGPGNVRPFEIPNQREGDNANLTGSLHKIGPMDSRNKRSVWTIPTAPFPEAHFATFPPALVEPCILAGSREGDVVLDPFLGSGTTAMVAKRLGRRAVGIDLNADYLSMAVRRCAQQGLMPVEAVS